MNWTSFDHDEIDPRIRYKLLSGAITPRPIALVTSMSPEGLVNAAPFSFFNVLSADPGVVAIGVESHADGRIKDTSRNIRENGEFVVNLVSREIMRAMKTCAGEFPPDVEELGEAGLATVASTSVAPPRIEASPAAFECTRHVTIEISASRQIVLGMVRRLHFREGVVDLETMRVKPRALDLIGRMAGPTYAGLNDLFVL